jgi:LysM repeat protein
MPKMNLHKLIFTENACYKAGRKITVKGIMVHSTGANNPWLKRYVGPDDGLLGKNQYNNHWNTHHPGGREVCVHGFIGKLADGTIATYQTLPWDHRGWHAGGSANNTHIGFEICEDGLVDGAYFAKVYKEAVELCVYLCKLYGLTEQNIICHSEGYRKGVASNHGDVMHWFPKHGKSMDTFRADVKLMLNAPAEQEEPKTEQKEEATEYPAKLTAGYYRVRKEWKDSKSQIGAYRVLANAKAAADKNLGTFVFSNDGVSIYPTQEKKEETYRIHTVVKGDTLWDIAAKYLGNGTRYPEIKTLNDLKSNTIYSGWKLKIPN